MKTLFLIVASAVVSILFSSTGGWCLSADDIIRLKQAGIDDITIQSIINEKTVETCAFTVDELVGLKKAGFRNSTLKNMVESASSVKDPGMIEYGTDIRPIRALTAKDIIELKKAGISDQVIQAVVSGAKNENDEDYLRAWNMLEKMGVIVDGR